MKNFFILHKNLRTRKITHVHFFGDGIITFFTFFIAQFLFLRKIIFIYDVTSQKNYSENVLKNNKVIASVFIRYLDIVITHNPVAYSSWNIYKHIHVVQLINPIDTDRFRPIDIFAKKKNQLSLLEKQYDIVLNYTGFLRKGKGIEEFIPIAKGLKEALKNQRIIFLMVGSFKDSYYEKKYKKMLADNDLLEVFKFIGHTKEPEIYYQISDIFLFLSESEGLPNSCLEAQSCGLPLIIKKNQGIEKIILNENSGLSVKDWSDAKEKLLIYAKNPALVKSSSKAARFNAIARFDYKKNIKFLTNVYSDY